MLKNLVKKLLLTSQFQTITPKIPINKPNTQPPIISLKKWWRDSNLPMPAKIVKINTSGFTPKAKTKITITTIEFEECAEGKECFISGLESNFPATTTKGRPRKTNFFKNRTKRSFKKATNDR